MVIEKLIRTLGEEAGVALPPVRVTGDDPVLPSVFRVGTAAAASVGAATAAIAAFWRRGGSVTEPDSMAGETSTVWASERETPDVSVDVRHAAVAFRSERYFQIDGENLDPWAPLSGDYRTVDGWIRLHCNFDHHRDAALRALDLPPGAEKGDLVAACESRTGAEIEEAVTREGGCAAAMRTRSEWLAHPQGRAVAESPLIGISRLDRAIPGEGAGCSSVSGPGARPGRRMEHEGSGARSGRRPERAGPGVAWHMPGVRPLAGLRVLDLTRVIAGPVAGRFLAAHGAEVLRVGARHLPEVPGLVVETAFGKRSCHIDLREEPEALRELVREADVVIQAYRPGAIAAKGFGAEELAALRPGIVSVEISAYGSRGPWASRRGFDSLVQMACGIAHEGGDGTRPHPLPAQVLDHATGYLAAFGALAALLRREGEGGSWRVELSLARTAKWLDDLGRIGGADTAEPSADDLFATMASQFGTLTYVMPPGMIDGAAPYYASPPSRQGEHPRAWISATSSGGVN
jgi:crotonobetainyl-CoA:carnitine CoA-transferase CaiB-like acyl-CoA transferase